MGWKNIWRTRARFHHRLDFVDADIKTLAKENTQKIINKWNALGDTPPFSEQFTYKEISFWPIAKEALDSLVKNHTEDAIFTIENTKEILRRYGINCVLYFYIIWIKVTKIVVIVNIFFTFCCAHDIFFKIIKMLGELISQL